MNPTLPTIFKAQQTGFQVWLAYIGFALGMLILLGALQLYGQLGAVLGDSKKMGSYVLISKQVSMGNTLFFSRPTFSASEVEDIKAQPFVESLAPLVSNQFEVMAYAEQAGFYSELFFEAIDKKFLDEQVEDFEWKEGQKEIPIILAKDMLDLYNFGFALGKGGNLPQISTTTAKLISIGIRLRGEKGEKRFTGRIVGFSERISSVLVPVSFMKWANKNVGAGKPFVPSRMLLKVRNSASPELTTYLSNNGYQVNEDRLRVGKIGGIVQGLMSGIGVVGALFMLLSGFLFLMNFRAILAEAKQEIMLLLQLGYTHKMLTQYLMRSFVIMLAIVVFAVFAVLYVGEAFCSPVLVGMGLDVPQGLFWWIWLSGLCLACLVAGANYWNIKRNLVA
ncbi:MAG: ABC transporter permease [Bacteroidetes bacterium]|nr:MAG: ABC transporter permease [Bacteroidota bacterium]